MKTKNKKKMKKLIHKQNDKIKSQQNVEKDVLKSPKSQKSPNSQNIQTQTDTNMDNTNPTIQINKLIAETDKNTYKNSEFIFANWSDMITEYMNLQKITKNT